MARRVKPVLKVRCIKALTASMTVGREYAVDGEGPNIYVICDDAQCWSVFSKSDFERMEP